MGAEPGRGRVGSSAAEAQVSVVGRPGARGAAGRWGVGRPVLAAPLCLRVRVGGSVPGASLWAWEGLLPPKTGSLPASSGSHSVWVPCPFSWSPGAWVSFLLPESLLGPLQLSALQSLAAAPLCVPLSLPPFLPLPNKPPLTVAGSCVGSPGLALSQMKWMDTREESAGGWGGWAKSR